MPGHRLTQSQYAHQRVVEHFGDLIAQLDEQALTYISAVVWSFTISIGIGYPVHQYISTGLLSFEEFSEDSLFPGSVSNGSGYGSEPTRFQMAVWVTNTPERSIRVRFDGPLTTRLNWASCQRVVQWVHLQIHIMLLFFALE